MSPADRCVDCGALWIPEVDRRCEICGAPVCIEHGGPPAAPSFLTWLCESCRAVQDDAAGEEG